MGTAGTNRTFGIVARLMWTNLGAPLEPTVEYVPKVRPCGLVACLDYLAFLLLNDHSSAFVIYFVSPFRLH